MKALKQTLKWFLGIAGFLVVIVVAIVLGVWMFPESVLTSNRVSRFVAPLVKFIPKEGAAERPLVNLTIEKNGFSNRTITIDLRPGCYGPADLSNPSEVCLDRATVSLSLRLDRATIVKLTSLRTLDVEVTRGVLHPSPGPAESPPDEKDGGSPFDIFKYFDEQFAWGPLRVQVDRFEIPASKLSFIARLDSFEKMHSGTTRSPTLRLRAEAISPEWSSQIDTTVTQSHEELTIPSANVTYSARGANPLFLRGAVSGTYKLKSGDVDLKLDTEWKNPAAGIGMVQVKNAIFQKRVTGMGAQIPLNILLEGETPFGRPPLLPVKVKVGMRTDRKEDFASIDFKVGVDTYNFAGIVANSDLEGTLTLGDELGLKWRKGELRLEVADFAKTIRRLDRTSWAVPAPFNVFRGPITLKTEPFRETADVTTLPVALITDLTSQEQAFQTETRAELDIGKKKIGLLAVRLKTLIKKIQLRLPDYDPLAPVPALARDSRIVRPTATPKVAAATGTPMTIEVTSGPDSIVLLNRFFRPSFAGGLNLKTTVGGAEGTVTGAVRLGRPFEIQYLNRDILLERLDVVMNPQVEITARVSMKRSGFKIFADLNQRFGKTQIELGSEPPLQEGEIVSLLLYGMPRNSISTEQTKSVGSAQAAMGSEALGIFSFWAFASTPIESVLYDPETQTYSAVIKLPGGLVASIGSNWENERQVALSKSLGRSWAVSTEVMQDAEGVERGGTLLRWRKSY